MIPRQLYRGAMGAHHELMGTVQESARDDYLAVIIKHASTTGGSTGEAFSMSADRSVAAKFMRKGGSLLRVDTEYHPGDFWTIENILKYDGPRLVRERKITEGTLIVVIRLAIDEHEQEIFMSSAVFQMSG